ncbi:hypothetical protein Dsin_020768 [Dipteronia sinensis]|uniref:Reverse transcriptase zinc-binding domain-containing protein n=1 Tax=Dipteronia sinensis TaxID=43782 RepID=A0AAE0AAB6_9ROSI|nr:hypothetical protein Dsin_020768 [Dipteronia sinensis]
MLQKNLESASSMEYEILVQKWEVGATQVMVRWQWNNSKQDSAFVKAIHKLFEGGTSTASYIKEGLQIVIGRDDRASFWEDIRWDSILLRIVFPRIFALSSKKVGKVCEFGKWKSVNWEWDILLRRPLFDWENEQWKCLIAALDSAKLHSWIHDTIALSFSPNGAFSVSSFRKCVKGTPVVNQCNSTLVWNGFCPLKVEVFVWNLMKGRTLVKVVMRIFGMDISLNPSCTFCNSYFETIDHVFLQCEWSWNLRKGYMSWWDVPCCINNSLKEWTEGWLGLCPSVSSKRGWCILFSAIVWTIWESWNQAVFINKGTSFKSASDMIKFRVGW